MTWFFFALGSAVFASLTTIFAKIGIEGVPSNLATALRTIIVLFFSWIMVFITHQQAGLGSISHKSWLFLILSGLSTGISWLCYYRAVQIGAVSKVVSVDKLSIVFTFLLSVIFLSEKFTVKTFFGCLLVTAGALLMAL